MLRGTGPKPLGDRNPSLFNSLSSPFLCSVFRITARKSIKKFENRNEMFLIILPSVITIVNFLVQFFSKGLPGK